MTKKGKVSSRFDYWLILSPLLFDTVHTDIEPSIKTDHINLTFLLKETPKRGKGLGDLTTLF